ncbi:hypothetical protein MSAS_22050 [Mycobacterium saskatchewanense]|uniref:Helix-turn-helix domain-containing protein n=1 Tax=Mycobacterium saskatchewanense TaxID=220927 RepID=A0AAJ3TUM8_9MYCO|nr:helix-turn-helix domain-containing protein [Mycobacterium saskatchewanense]ORW70675.1 hypothetical protein AWC23_16480 [Mycobacterium saskatchewanense]BBX63031.1 hypothetical protein MSAS_22050 [Mycobacterium saskatchewanense]
MPKSGNPQDRAERRYPELIGVVAAAQRCDVSSRTIHRWISDGRLNAVRVGPRLLKVRAEDLDALMQPVGGAA